MLNIKKARSHDLTFLVSPKKVVNYKGTICIYILSNISTGGIP